jgi:hypothetical protein
MTTQHDPRPSLDELSHADAVTAMHDNNPPDLAYIQCPCGFRVSGFDEEENRLAYEGHDCEYHSDEREDDDDDEDVPTGVSVNVERPPTRSHGAWHESLARVFISLGGFATIVAVVYILTR